MERIEYIDELKGLAIILVVLGHVVVGKDEAEFLYQFIYSFHMPLFMFLAGCTTAISYRRSRLSDIQYVQKRFINIMVPYFVWAFLSPIISAHSITMVDWSNIAKKTFITNRMFWFLPTLYGLIMVYVCCQRICMMLKLQVTWREMIIDIIAWGGGIILLVVAMIITKYQLFRDMVGFIVPFFVGGMYIKYEWIRKWLYQWWMVLICFVIFVALIGQFNFDNASVITSLQRMILGLCASILLLYIFQRIPFASCIKKQLRFLGMNTLLTYILHGQVMKALGLLQLTFESCFANLVWYTFASIVICYVCAALAWILNRIPLLQTIFLGKWEKG